MFRAIESDMSFPDSFQPVFRCLGDKGRKTTMDLIVHSSDGLRASEIRSRLLELMDRHGRGMPASTVANYLADLEDSDLVESIKVGNRKSGGCYVATEFGRRAWQGVIELGKDLAITKTNIEIERLLDRLPSKGLDRVIELAQERINQASR